MSNSPELSPPDLSKIRTLTKQDYAVSIPALVTHFHRGKHHLYYVGTQHQTANTLREAETLNPSCITVDKTIKKYRPNFMIIEGVPTALGLRPFEGATKAVSTVNEIDLAIMRANNKGIPYMGGEPEFKDIVSAMRRRGYTQQDVIAMDMLSHISYIHHDYIAHGRLFDENELIKTFEQFSAHSHFGSVLPGERPNFSEFKAWYERHRIDRKALHEVTTDDLDAYDSGDQNYFRKLSSDILRVREEHLLATIADALGKHSKVMVVYGNAHMLQSRPVFEEMFGGMGQDIQFVPGETIDAQNECLRQPAQKTRGRVTDHVDRSPSTLAKLGAGNTTVVVPNK